MSTSYTSKASCSLLHCLSVAGLLSALFATAGGCHWASAGLNAEGTRFHDRGQYHAAIARFNEAIQADPVNPDGYYNLGATYYAQAKLYQNEAYWRQAEDNFQQCLDVDKNHVECHRGLVVLLVERQRQDEAFKLLENWAHRNPDLADPKIELARLYEESGKKETAKEYLLAAIEADTQNPRAWNALGKLHEESGNYQQALSNYAVSLRDNPMQPRIAARVVALESAVGPGHVGPPTRDIRFAREPARSVQ